MKKMLSFSKKIVLFQEIRDFSLFIIQYRKPRLGLQASIARTLDDNHTIITSSLPFMMLNTFFV